MRRRLALRSDRFSIAPIQAFLKQALSAQVLYLCVAADIVFIGLNVLYEFVPAIDDPSLQITLDRGYAEVFQYVKTFWISGILATAAFKSRSVLYGVWASFFTYLLLDDSLRIHENWSKAPYFPSLFGINSHASGEFIISVSIGLIFLTLIAVTYRSGDALARAVSRFLVWMILLLGFVGVFIDGFHTVVQVGLLDPVLTTLEDGGEMVIVSVILSFVFLLPKRIKAESWRFIQSKGERSRRESYRR